MNADALFLNHVVLDVTPFSDPTRAFAIAIPNSWDVSTRIEGAYDVHGTPALLGVFGHPARRPGGAMAWVTAARIPEVDVGEYLRTVHAQEGWAVADAFHQTSSGRTIVDAHRGGAFRRQVAWVDGGKLWCASLSAPLSDWQHHARDYNVTLASVRLAQPTGDARLEARQRYASEGFCFELPDSWPLACGIPGARDPQVLHEASARLDDPDPKGGHATLALIRVRWLRAAPMIGQFVPRLRAEVSGQGCAAARTTRLWRTVPVWREAVEFDVALRGGAVITAVAAVREMGTEQQGTATRGAVEVLALAPRVERMPGLQLRTRRAAYLALATATMEEP